MIITRLLVLSAFAGIQASAAVTLGSPFTDHAVLQRDHLVSVWGSDEPGKTVSISVQGITTSTVAATDGRWTMERHAASFAGGWTLRDDDIR